MPKTLKLIADTIESETEFGTHIFYVVHAIQNGEIIDTLQIGQRYILHHVKPENVEENDRKLGEWWS